MAKGEFLFVMVVPVRVNMLNIRRRRCLMPSKSAGWEIDAGTSDLKLIRRSTSCFLSAWHSSLSPPRSSFYLLRLVHSCGLTSHCLEFRLSHIRLRLSPCSSALPRSYVRSACTSYPCSSSFMAGKMFFFADQIGGERVCEVLEVREFSGLGSRQGAELEVASLNVEGVAPGLFIDGRRLLCTSSSPLLQQE